MGTFTGCRDGNAGIILCSIVIGRVDGICPTHHRYQQNLL
jgi:hypothetical protein